MKVSSLCIVARDTCLFRDATFYDEIYDLDSGDVVLILESESIEFSKLRSDLKVLTQHGVGFVWSFALEFTVSEP